MLFDKDILNAINNKLQTNYPDFNIQVLLYMLQCTTRPLGYPPHKDGVNECYYLNSVNEKINQAKKSRNGPQHHMLMRSIYHIMVCFSYIHNTLYAHGVDSELNSLIFQAIDARADSTNEERCAEKSLLAMILQQPQEVLKLISNHQVHMPLVNMHQLLQNQMTFYANKRLKKLVNNIPDNTPCDETQRRISDLFQILKCAEDALMHSELLSKRLGKKTCLITIGSYLLNNVNNPEQQDWITGCPFLSSAIVFASQEKGKSEVASYIAARRDENNVFSFFRTYPKEIKLSSAEKFCRVLNNEPGVVFSEGERDALQSDTGSRLTNIYLQYQHIVHSRYK